MIYFEGIKYWTELLTCQKSTEYHTSFFSLVAFYLFLILSGKRALPWPYVCGRCYMACVMPEALPPPRSLRRLDELVIDLVTERVYCGADLLHQQHLGNSCVFGQL